MAPKSDLPQGTLDLLILKVVAFGPVHGYAIATGRDARFYRLTRKGRARLDAETASWRRLPEAVGLILKMSEGVSE